MRHWQAIPVATVAALLTGAALFTSAPPVAHAILGIQIAIDCDTSTLAVDAACVLPAFPTTSSTTISVVMLNNDVDPHNIAGFNIHVLNPDSSLLSPPASVNTNLDSNPNFNQAALVAPGWTCASPVPAADDGTGAPGTTISFLSCIDASGTGDAIAGGASVVLATVNYNVLKDGIANLTLAGGSVADDNTVVLADCDSGDCVGASVQVGTVFVATSTPTVTGTATNTPIPGTPTSLAFVTVTPTGSPTVPATPAAGESPVAGESPTTGGGQPTGNEPGGGAGAGGGRPISLPDTGSGAKGGIDWTVASLFVLLTLAAGALAGGLYFGAARITEARRGPRND